MKILLPPSETKRTGGRPRPLDVAGLALPALAPQREAVVDALVALSADADDARRVLKLSDRQLADVDHNRMLRTAATMAAVDRYTGVLTQLPAPAGCIAEDGDGVTCTDAVGLDGADSLAISRNGKQVYVTGRDSDAVAVFERDRTTGALTQFPAPMGCIANDGDGVTCTDAVALDGPGSIAIDGNHVYVATAGWSGTDTYQPRVGSIIVRTK